MDIKYLWILVVATSAAVIFLAITSDVDDTKMLDSPLFRVRMWQASHEKGFHNGENVEGYSLNSENGDVLGYEDIEGSYGDIRPLNTHGHTCQTCIETCETCVDTCENTCVDTCSDTCEATCADTCENTCEATCADTCADTCSDTCEDTCEATCEVSCGGTCEGATCPDTYDTCDTCDDTCDATCPNTCDTCSTCNQPTCDATCPDTCSTCDATCPNTCLCTCSICSTCGSTCNTCETQCDTCPVTQCDTCPSDTCSTCSATCSGATCDDPTCIGYTCDFITCGQDTCQLTCYSPADCPNAQPAMHFKQPYKTCEWSTWYITYPNTHKGPYNIYQNIQYNTTPVIHEISEGSTYYNPFDRTNNTWYETIFQYLRIIYIWMLLSVFSLLYTLHKKF